MPSGMKPTAIGLYLVKKTRTNRLWAVDYDYLDKLAPNEREWLEKFTDEYYRGELTEPTIHNISTKSRRKRLTDANNAANRDIYCIHPSKIAEHRKKIPDYDQSHKSRTYFEKDYSTIIENPENAILEVIEINKKPATITELPKKLVG